MSGHKPNVYPDQVVWQLVRLFASHDDPSLKTKVARLTKAIVDYQPDLQNEVTAKKKALEQAVQGKYIFKICDFCRIYWRYFHAIMCTY